MLAGIVALGLGFFPPLPVAGPPTVVVRPDAAPGPLDNPLKGWCPYANAGAIRQPYSMVFQYAPWRELEPKEGVYAFDAWEKRAWEKPAAKGKHVVSRVYLDYPGRPSGLPDWLREKGVKMTPYKDHGGGTSPDYRDPRLVEGMERLIEAMGKRYDGDPRVGFIELGLLGFWGEWHTWPREELFANEETQRRVIDAYRKAFPHKILMARTANGYAGKQDWLGFHDDMFPEDTDNGEDWSFLAGIRRAGRSENWKRAVIGGEMALFQAKALLGAGYEGTLKQLEAGHFTWVGPYCPALEGSKDARFRERSESLVRRMGYQFRVVELEHSRQLKSGDALSIKIQGENEGVAPFSYPWKVEVVLMAASGKVAGRSPLRTDVRTWGPGKFEVVEKVEVKVGPGRYRLGLGIVDPGTGRAAVGFANSGERREGWTLFSELEVVKAGEGGSK